MKNIKSTLVALSLLALLYGTNLQAEFQNYHVTFKSLRGVLEKQALERLDQQNPKYLPKEPLAIQEWDMTFGGPFQDLRNPSVKMQTWKSLPKIICDKLEQNHVRCDKINVLLTLVRKEPYTRSEERSRNSKMPAEWALDEDMVSSYKDEDHTSNVVVYFRFNDERDVELAKDMAFSAEK